MPAKAGLPSCGARRKTPLLPPLGTRNSSSRSKSPYSASVDSQPDPFPEQNRIPSSTFQLSIGPSMAFHPLVSLPLNSGFQSAAIVADPNNVEPSKAKARAAVRYWVLFIVQ